MMKGNAFKRSPGSNRRLIVGLQPPGKVPAHRTIEPVVPRGLRPTCVQYVRELPLKAVPPKTFNR